jgi:putative transcriptional regulator
MPKLQGHLLVASPHLSDPNFLQTVVLMIHHSDEGAFGVVLNRPHENSIEDLWKEVAETPCKAKGLINVGGPVSGPLIALHTDESLAEMEVFPGVYFAAQREHLEKLIAQDTHRFRFFVGHSGWARGQLESELEQGSWLTAAATVDYVFYEDDDLWKKVTHQIGRSMLSSALRIDQVPPDPSVN